LVADHHDPLDRRKHLHNLTCPGAAPALQQRCMERRIGYILFP
jgi:hypothetical protein